MFPAVLMVNVSAASTRQNKPQNYWNISTFFFDYYVVNVQGSQDLCGSTSPAWVGATVSS